MRSLLLKATNGQVFWAGFIVAILSAAVYGSIKCPIAELLSAIGTWAYWLCLVGANVFVLLYASLAKWWRTEFGRNLFSFMFVLALVLDHAVVRRLVGEYDGYEIVRAILNVAGCVVVWWRVLIFINVQIRKRDDPSGPEGSSSVPSDRDDHLGAPHRSDSPVVEGVDPVGSSDERLG